MNRFLFRGWRRVALLGTVVGAGILGALASSVVDSFSGFSPSQAGPASSQRSTFTHRPLVGKADAEIGQYAIDFAQGRGMVGTRIAPTVALVRPIRRDQFESLGFPWINIPDPEPPMALVILRGEFDLSRQPGGHLSPEPAKYLGLIFESRQGTMVFLAGSKNGGLFREALNDPSLPDDVPGVPRPSNVILVPKPTPRYLPGPVIDRGAPNRDVAGTAGPAPPGPYSLTPVRPIPSQATR